MALARSVAVDGTIPPGAPGPVRCHLVIFLDEYVSLQEHALDAVNVSFAWWGSDVAFRARLETGGTAVWRLAVNSGPKAFARYLEDASVLRIDVGTGGKPGVLIGSAQARGLAAVVEKRTLALSAHVYNATRQAIGRLLMRMYIVDPTCPTPSLIPEPETYVAQSPGFVSPTVGTPESPLSTRTAKLAQRLSALRVASPARPSASSKSSRPAARLHVRVQRVALDDPHASPVGLYVAFRPNSLDRMVASAPMERGVAPPDPLLDATVVCTAPLADSLSLELLRLSASLDAEEDEVLGVGIMPVIRGTSGRPSVIVIKDPLTDARIGAANVMCFYQLDPAWRGGHEDDVDDKPDARAHDEASDASSKVTVVICPEKVLLRGARAGNAVRLALRFADATTQTSAVRTAADHTALWSGEVHKFMTDMQSVRSILVHVHALTEDGRVIGSGKMDIAPLVLGMETVHGWYDLFNQSGAVVGDILVRAELENSPSSSPIRPPTSTLHSAAARTAPASSSSVYSSHSDPNPAALQHALQDLAALHARLQRRMQSLEGHGDDVEL